MTDLDRDLAAFHAQLPDLESTHNGQWVVFHDGQFVGSYPDFNRAAEEAVQRFGSGPYLIKQVGAPPITLPASVMFNLANA
jgi:hypothetical protein